MMWVSITLQIDEKELNNSKQTAHEFSSTNCDREDYVFELYWRSDPETDSSELSICLDSLPNAMRAVKINPVVDCRQNRATSILWSAGSNGETEIILKLGSDAERFGDNLYDQYQSFLKHKIPMSTFENAISIRFDCKLQILTKYDLYGGIFSETDQPIFVKPALTHNTLVWGYLNEMFDFDVLAIEQTPLSIYDLIYKYFLMILNVNDEQTGLAEFIWKFENEFAVQSFWNCKHSDVITSKKFEVNGCVFYFELTPNGWTSMIPEDECALWLAVDSLPSLPEYIDSIHVRFTIVCDEVEFVGSEEIGLTTPERGMYSVTTANYMKRDAFKSLKKFEFELTVQIISMAGFDGNKIRQNEESESEDEELIERERICNCKCCIVL